MLPIRGGEHTIQHGTSDRGVMEPKGVDNSKELLATWIALQTFANTLRGAHVHIKIDNTSAVAYINHTGGVHSRELCQIAINMWNWCLDRDLTISAEHLPGIQNATANFESRNKKNPSEWELNQAVSLMKSGENARLIYLPPACQSNFQHTTVGSQTQVRQQ